MTVRRRNAHVGGTHLGTWLAHCRDGHYDVGLVPAYVERAFRRYLECGILAHGFAADSAATTS